VDKRETIKDFGYEYTKMVVAGKCKKPDLDRFSKVYMLWLMMGRPKLKTFLVTQEYYLLFPTVRGLPN